MTLFWYLVLAHLILDYPLQGEFLALQKKNYNFLLAVHCLMWGLGVSAVLDHFGALQTWKIFFLVGGHAIVDYIKCHYLSNWLCDCYGDPLCEVLQHKQSGSHVWRTDPLGLPLLIDQVCHIVQLLVCLL